MIKQIEGHISRKQLMTDEFSSTPVANFARNYPITAAALQSIEDIQLNERISYHKPEVIKCLPKPNCSVPTLESSPHLWHFIETETGIEFLVFSDGLRKNHFKGTSIEVILDTCRTDGLLAQAYIQLVEYMFARAKKK